MRFGYIVIFSFLLIGCGIESTNPIGTSDNQSGVEKAVFIERTATDSNGTTVQCSLNPALETDSVGYQVFTEFEGSRLETRNVTSHQPAVFPPYNPSSDGSIICVLLLADAEFESDSLWIERQ